MIYEVKGEEAFDYLLYLPDGYDGKKRFPLHLFLHGAGERGDDLSRLQAHALPKLIARGDSFPGIIVCPQCPEHRIWLSFSETLWVFLTKVIEKYHADKKAITISGLSMGAFGTYQVLADHPEAFAGAAACCGGAQPGHVASEAKDIPIRIFHGERDGVIYPMYSRDIYERLLRHGAKNATFITFPEDGHNCWDDAYERTDLIAWLFSRRRQD